MSLWSRQESLSYTLASIAILFIPFAVAYYFLNSPSPRILLAPEPNEDGPYKYSLFEGGATLHTLYGKLRYFELGPKNGIKVLLIHGISTPCPVWHKVIPKLVDESSYRILCYDLVGRGYSDGPAQIQYNMPVYISQLLMLVTFLPEWSGGTFNIIGYSMGGAIATTFASLYPERVDKLLLYAPAGLIKSRQLPWLERLIRSGYLPVSMAQSLLLSGAVKSQFLNFNELLIWQSKKHNGFMYSFTSTLTNDMIWDLQSLYETVLGKFGHRMQLIWGDKDITCPLSDADSIEGLQVQIVKGGRHDFIVQMPFVDEIAHITVNFFNSS